MEVLLRVLLDDQSNSKGVDVIRECFPKSMVAVVIFLIEANWQENIQSLWEYTAGYPCSLYTTSLSSTYLKPWVLESLKGPDPEVASLNHTNLLVQNQEQLQRGGSITGRHADQPGASTKVICLAGEKLWVIHDDGEVNDRRLQSVLLTPSSRLIMLPDTKHLVWSPKPTLCQGHASISYDSLHLLLDGIQRAELSQDLLSECGSIRGKD
ncbi:hypothetical protein FFLO_07070 [Filobasidium floriforme]|uniref:Uncharacterized protein n=1 Tax=Filobasidium floriforme TaxID=5210 RepID=A0A8K0NK06_9TREE|nr:uncharacterized protein HD553DRAFT_345881 [Filobasidium floriforme]KAG7527303.1 hypothetical protein FFLO_07070 [Filobasidium floriforme]KAH8079014.1 hypothetical protein HD553DRAFT_345881 [Filobasidium floriforme]